MMPGLGGDPNHFHWLARALMQAGWPVALLEHPGSDAAAVQALLEGRQSFDGAAVLKQRMADLSAVLDAQRQGDLNIPGEEVVLMGHSLGALTALLASGAGVVPGMDQRCEGALAGLPLTNLSKLLQCELAAGARARWQRDGAASPGGGGVQQLWWLDLAARFQSGLTDSPASDGWDARSDHPCIGRAGGSFGWIGAASRQQGGGG